MEDHEHKWDRLEVGPPKMFRCSVRGCKARVAVDPKTKGPDLKAAELAAASAEPPPPAAE